MSLVASISPAVVNCLPNTIVNRKGIEKVDDRFNGWEAMAFDFQRHKVVRHFTERQKEEMLDMLIDNALGGELDWTGIPSVNQQQRLKPVMDKYLEGLTKSGNIFSRNLFLPGQFLKRMPPLKRIYDNMVEAEENHKGNEETSNGNYRGLTKWLRKASAEYGLEESLAQKSITKITGKSKAHRDLEAKFKEFSKIASKEKDVAKALNHYERNIQEWVNKGEGQMFKDFSDLLLAPRKTIKNKSGEIERGFKDLETEYKPSIYEAAKIFRNKIQPHVLDMTTSGIGHYLNVIKQVKGIKKFDVKDAKTGLTKIETTEKNLKELLRRLNDKEMQNTGFYPVLALDILPKIATAVPKMVKAKNQGEFDESVDIINQLDGILSDNVNLQVRMKIGSSKDKEAQAFNYNILPMIESYAKSANVFQYTIYNTSQHIKALNFLANMMEKNAKLKGHKDYIENLGEVTNGMKNYLQNIYKIQINEADMNNQWQADFVRGLTAWQFFNKLGFNVRSAARNATQSILNYVHFGWNGIKEINEAMGADHHIQTRVEAGLVNNGIRFANLPEVYGNLKQRVELDENIGGYQAKLDYSFGEQITEGLVKAADVSGIFMQKVENDVNRRWTYTLGYVKHWEMMKVRNHKLEEEFKGKPLIDIAKSQKIAGLDKKTKKKDIQKYHISEIISELEGRKIDKYGLKNEYELKFDEWKQVKADRFAREMVRKLHFDYSTIGKAPWMTTKPGAIVGQFQHYGLNFFTYNRELVVRGGGDIANGDWSGPNAWRMYRMGMIYGSINALISPMLNQDIGNLIQHDTLERIDNGVTQLTSDDDEERLRASYGDGVFSFLGPTASSGHDMAMLIGLYDMLGLPEDTMKLLLGYEEDPLLDNDKGKFIRKQFNLQFSRLYDDTGPKLRRGGGLGEFAEGELGINYISPETKEARIALGLDVVKPLEPYNFDSATFSSLGNEGKIQDNQMLNYVKWLQQVQSGRNLTLEQQRLLKANKNLL